MGKKATNSTFINYHHPSDQTNSNNRRKVASYIGTFYRNRSRPSTRHAPGTTRPGKSKTSSVVAIRAASPKVKSDAVPTVALQDIPSRQHCASAQASPLALAHDGYGYRVDPFSSYPIEFRDCIPAALDFFVQFFGPAHVIRPEVLTAEAGAAAVQQYFQYAMQSTLMFEALVALSQANLAVANWVDSAPDPDTVYHYTKSLNKLRLMLHQKNGYAEDSVLFAIVALMGIEYLLNDLPAFEMHLGGLRKIISLRGGLDKLGWPLLLKPLITSIEVFWAYISKYQQDCARVIAPSTDLDLKCPYNRPGDLNDLGEMIRSLSPGFRDMAVQHRLSVPVITLLHRISTKGRYIDQINYRPPMPTEDPIKTVNAMSLQETEYCVRLLASADLTSAERVVCIGLLAVLMGTTRSERFSSLYLKHLKRNAAELLRLRANLVEDDPKEYWIWTTLVIGGSFVEPESEEFPSDYLNDERFHLLMGFLEFYGHLDWPEIVVIMQKFMWNPRCEHLWRLSWQFVRVQKCLIKDTNYEVLMRAILDKNVISKTEKTEQSGTVISIGNIKPGLFPT